MSDKIKKLKIRKLLKELDYLEENYNYTNEIITNSDNDFMCAIDKVLDKDPTLKKVYEDKLNKKIEEAINKIKEEDEIDMDTESKDEEDSVLQDEENSETDKKLRNIFRSIVKVTHPDKVSDKKMNDIYLEATKAYDNNSRIDMYKVCDKLDINYDLDEEDEEEMLKSIEKYKDKISFLESTFTWKWYNTEDEKVRDNIVMTFVRMKIK